jgi:2'-5' RNA ligase
MPFAVMLFFDIQTEKMIVKIWQTLARNNLVLDILDAGIRPHITLAIYEELNCRPCENELAKITSKTSSIAMQFTHLGLFTNPEPVVFASPVSTSEFLDFHKNIHVSLASEAKNSWDLYKPGKWVPHCTLALNFKMENLTEIINYCKELPFPMDVYALQIGVVKFQPVKDLFKYDFLTFET